MDADAAEIERAQLYLGSASPRRQMLLSQLGIRYFALAPSIDEHRAAGESAEALVARLAREKVWAADKLLRQRGFPQRPLLAADTEVTVDDRVLGKPADFVHAREILNTLSDRTHEVLTALALLHEGHLYESISRSHVTFRAISSAEIDAYWASGEPRDKAGAYAIQGIGAIFVSRLEGSYSGVMGLPLYELQQLLTRVGINCL